MNSKSGKIEALIQGRLNQAFPAHFLAFFDCFNRGLYFEAHEVLEPLWLSGGRDGTNHRFYKGLIQLAGAFVHVQKLRHNPALSLFKLAESNLAKYPDTWEGIHLNDIQDLIQQWKERIESAASSGSLLAEFPPPVLTMPRQPSGPADGSHRKTPTGNGH